MKISPTIWLSLCLANCVIGAKLPPGRMRFYCLACAALLLLLLAISWFERKR